MAGLVPAIHVFHAALKAWMPGTRPGMTLFQNVRECMLETLDHLVLTVRDIETSVAFYTRALGMRETRFTPPGKTDTRVALSYGRQKINLHQQGREYEPKATAPTPGSADLCFLANWSLQDVIAHLRSEQVPILDGPVQRTGATGPIMSIYIRDPDGNLIEISNRV
jgi:catechol 2,3-dioxygenase-like lactoylglutathione lyase family enzyme